MMIGPGNLIGEEDAIKDRLYSTTVQCASAQGLIYAISIDNFHQVVKKTNDEAWTHIKRNAL